MTKGQNKKVVIQSIFKRNGGRGKDTKIFSDLPPGDQEYFRSKIALVEDEHFVVVHYKSPQKWSLVTTTRFLFTEDNIIRIVESSDILSASYALGSPTLPVKNKSEMNRLKLVTRSCGTLFLTLEPGPAYFAMLSVLKYLAIAGSAIRETS